MRHARHMVTVYDNNIVLIKKHQSIMKQATLPEVIYLDVDSLDYSESVKAANAVCVEPINEIGVI